MPPHAQNSYMATTNWEHGPPLVIFCILLQVLKRQKAEPNGVLQQRHTLQGMLLHRQNPHRRLLSQKDGGVGIMTQTP